ncbi:MAG TPA: methyltransferase domain-containing protein [Pyrinomonadaceae bacterium]|nr:methyltransferase domain-containing protein [Pyrinomonadaceae bacterium]
MNNEIQAQRNFWNSEADAFQKIYTHRKSKFSNTLDQIFRKDMYERYEFTIKNCEPIPGRTFLDVGCGNGMYSLELARRGARKVVGLDIAEVMIGLCNESATAKNLNDRCTFIQTDLLQWDNGGAKFDVSFGIGLFDYIRDPLPVLRKMRELSTDKAIMAFPRLWTWRAPVRKVRLTIKGCDVYFYSAARINQLMKDAGFSRHTLTRVGKLYCVVAHP